VYEALRCVSSFRIRAHECMHACYIPGSPRETPDKPLGIEVRPGNNVGAADVFQGP
jgi:hypothetical protein